MNGLADLLLLAVVVLDVFVLGTSRVMGCVRATALQGVALSLLPVAMWWAGSAIGLTHLVLLAVGTLAIKAVVIPLLLVRAIRASKAAREVEPFVSLHVSVLLGAALVITSFWLASTLPLPGRAGPDLLVPVALSTLLIGFLVLVTRRKAITQVVGYLLVENGVFVFGQPLAHQLPFVVELGMLLDLLVGVFVMGIAIHHISREFDAIDTDLLTSLKD